MKKWIIGSVMLGAVGVALALMRPERNLKPELRVVGTVILDGIDMYEMEFTNPTPHELVYWGYEASSPSLEFQYLEGGTWKEPRGFRCGTGLSRQVLPAGGKIRFFHPPPRTKVTRVGLDAPPPNFQLREIMEFKWLPEKLSTRLVNWQQEQNRKRRDELVTWSPPLEAAPMTRVEMAVCDALAEGVVMDVVNLRQENPHAFASPSTSSTPAAPSPQESDPFAPPARINESDPFAPAPTSASKAP